MAPSSIFSSTSQLAANQREAPALTINRSRIVVEDGKPNELVTRNFVLTNKGNASLDFVARPTCTCTNVSPMGGAILPGQTQELAVSVLLPDFPGAERTATVFVDSGDTKQPATAVFLTARTQKTINVEPPFLDFGCHPLKAEIPLHGYLTISRAGPATVEQVCVKNNLPDIFDITTTESDSERMLIRVSPRPNLPPGNYQATLAIGPEHSNAERISVRLTIEAPCSISPNIVAIKQAEADEMRVGSDISVLMRFRNKKLTGPIAALEPATGVSLVGITNAGPGIYRLLLQLSNTILTTSPTKIVIGIPNSDICSTVTVHKASARSSDVGPKQPTNPN